MGRDRDFSEEVKLKCWDKADLIMGRDPARWRYDRIDTPVMKDFHGKNGLCGWQYDHDTPVSRGGTSELSNCQVMQTMANKSNSILVHLPDRLAQSSSNIHLNRDFSSASNSFVIGIFIFMDKLTSLLFLFCRGATRHDRDGLLWQRP